MSLSKRKQTFKSVDSFFFPSICCSLICGGHGGDRERGIGEGGCGGDAGVVGYVKDC